MVVYLVHFFFFFLVFLCLILRVFALVLIPFFSMTRLCTSVSAHEGRETLGSRGKFFRET